MKIYLAGQCPYPEAQAHAERHLGRFLYSYIYVKKDDARVLRSRWRDKDIMVDSGGFSVRTAGASVSVREYRSFLSRLQGRFSVCFNLDTTDMAESLRNQRYLEAIGLAPLPVYHYSDYASREWRDQLQRFIDEYDYISVGGMAKRNLTREQYQRFLDYVFVRTGKTTKVHGLGLTSVSLMSHYPFYSVDSKTWLVPGLFGDFVTFKDGAYKRINKRPGAAPKHHGIMLTGPEKMKKAVEAFAKLERILTSRWENRGYVWN